MYNNNNNNNKFYFILIFLIILNLNLNNCQEEQNQITYYLSVNNGVTTTTCGNTIENACKSLINVMDSYVTSYPNTNNNNNSNNNITILIDDGVYSGVNNTNLNIFNMILTLKPINNNNSPSQVIFDGTNNNNARLFNIIEPTPSTPSLTSLTLNNLIFKNFNQTTIDSSSAASSSDDDDDDDEIKEIELKLLDSNNNGYGGVILINIKNSSLELNVENCEFNNNIANRGGVFFLQSPIENQYPVNVYFSNSQFQSNKGMISSGVGYSNWVNRFIVSACTFEDSYAPISGVSVLLFSNSELITIKSSNFTSNQKATTIQFIGTKIVNGSIISDCLFKDNVITGKGGAISMYQSNLVIDNTVFNNNYAGTLGGAIFGSGVTSYLILSNSQFIDNKSSGKGGALALQDMYSTISNCKFNSNSAYIGGSLCFEYSNVKLEDCSITNNECDSKGGAIFTTFSHLSFQGNNDISSNVAYEGSAIYCSASTLNITGGETSIPINGNTDLGNGTHSYEFIDDDNGIKVNDYNIYCALSPSYTFCTINGDLPYSDLCGASIIIENDGYTRGQIAGIIIGSVIGAMILVFIAAWFISKTTISEHFIRLKSSYTDPVQVN